MFFTCRTGIDVVAVRKKRGWMFTGCRSAKRCSSDGDMNHFLIDSILSLIRIRLRTPVWLFTQELNTQTQCPFPTRFLYNLAAVTSDPSPQGPCDVNYWRSRHYSPCDAAVLLSASFNALSDTSSLHLNGSNDHPQVRAMGV